MGDASLRNPHIARLVAKQLDNRNVARLSTASRETHAALELERRQRERQRARHRWAVLYHKTIVNQVDRVTKKGETLGEHVTRAQLTAHDDPHFNHDNRGHYDYYNNALEHVRGTYTNPYSYGYKKGEPYMYWEDNRAKNEILDGRARHLALKHLHPDYRREYERARYLARKHGHAPPPRVIFGETRS